MKVIIIFLLCITLLSKVDGQPYFEKMYPITPDSQMSFMHAEMLDESKIFIDYSMYTYWNSEKYILIVDTNFNITDRYYIHPNFTDNDISFGQTSQNLYIGSTMKDYRDAIVKDSSEVLIFNKQQKSFIKKRIRDKPDLLGYPLTHSLRVFGDRIYTISHAQMTNIPAGGFQDSMWRMTISDTNMNPLRIVELKLDKQLVGCDLAQVEDKFFMIANYNNFGTYRMEDYRKYMELFKFNSDWKIVAQRRFSYQDPIDDMRNRIISTKDKGLFVSGTLTPDSLHANPNHMELTFMKLDTNLNVTWTYRINCYSCILVSRIIEGSQGSFYICGYKDLLSWILKLDKNGNKIWEHQYRTKAEDIGSTASFFDSVFELESGNLIAAGLFRKTVDTVFNWSFWLLKLDRNGCPGYDCDDEVFLESKNIHIEQSASSLQVYPNPGNDRIEMALSERQRSGFPESYRVFNVNGKMILSDLGNQTAHQYLDTRQLAPGVYFITATFRDHTQQTIKWIKEND